MLFKQYTNTYANIIGYPNLIQQRKANMDKEDGESKLNEGFYQTSDKRELDISINQ